MAIVLEGSGPPVNEAERQAIRYLRDRLPASCRILPNFEVAHGRWYAAKLPAPKEVIQALMRANRAEPPMVVYGQIAFATAAFHCVRDTLLAWFPAEGA